MMNAHRVTFFLVVILSGLIFSFPSAGQTGIIVNNADSVWTTSVALSQDLANSTAGVQARVAVQYANSLRRLGLSTVPGGLQSLLEQMPARIVFQYANSSHQWQLSYPAALIDDTTPPVLSGIEVSSISIESVRIIWTTDEFATSTVLYGTQSGVYPQTVSDPLYAKQHTITLTGLTQGTTYYYEVRSTDRSGNTSTSSERSFTAQISIYLPLIIKNR